MATNNGQCGFFGDTLHECACTPPLIQRYLSRISGPLLDRIDLHIRVTSLFTLFTILRNTDISAAFAEDYNTSISVYYEVKRDGAIVDTVSVPVSQPTRAWVFPCEVDVSKQLLTGFALVYLAGTRNTVNLELYEATTPSSNPSPDAVDTIQMSLAAGEQRSAFLADASLFPALRSFIGILRGAADGPVAILAVLQTPIPNGLKYAILAPAYIDAMRRNTYMYLRDGFSLDADLPVSDYFGNSDDRVWDLLYESQSSTTPRRLATQSGAMVAIIGSRNEDEFDNDVTLEYLQGLNYASSAIDMSDGSANLAPGIAFVVRTGLG
jgi:hypothetical protein